MAIPADKLNIMMEELLQRSNQASKELNIISLEDYKILNKDKVAYLNFLKRFVSEFNKETNWFLTLLMYGELYYLTTIYLKTHNISYQNKEMSFKEKLSELNNIFFITNIILSDIKAYPNTRLKRNTLKINDKTYIAFLKTKNRLMEIQQEIEQSAFSLQDYMKDALENIEHIIKKYEEYKDYPDSFLDIFAYYYADLEDLEWTDEDREFVAKHYA